MWVIIPIIAAALASVYICARIYKIFPELPRFGRAARIFASVYVVAAAFVLFSVALSLINAAIVFFHIIVFTAIFDLIFFLVKKRVKLPRFDFAAAFSAVSLCVYLSVGYALCNTVAPAFYTVTTDKHVGNIRVVMFADAHVGSTFDGEKLADYVAQMQSYSPDIAVIAGDFADGATSIADMKAACKALGELSPRLGVFYVCGNHDRGYYNENDSRGYNLDDLISELVLNGVTVLRDDVARLSDNLYIAGRRDKSESRISTAELTSGLAPTDYVIVADHQPADYEAQKNVSDLVLSGHTHGGQMFPAGLIISAFNDSVYGHTRLGNTDYIVTSGISDWELRFKTGCRSEFVVIDIKGR